MSLRWRRQTTPELEIQSLGRDFYLFICFFLFCIVLHNCADLIVSSDTESRLCWHCFISVLIWYCFLFTVWFPSNVHACSAPWTAPVLCTSLATRWGWFLMKKVQWQDALKALRDSCLVSKFEMIIADYSEDRLWVQSPPPPLHIFLTSSHSDVLLSSPPHPSSHSATLSRDLRNKTTGIDLILFQAVHFFLFLSFHLSSFSGVQTFFPLLFTSLCAEICAKQLNV